MTTARHNTYLLRPTYSLAAFALLALASAACGPAPGATTLAFDQAGGDAWTFERHVTGTASGTCRTVVLARGDTHVVATKRGDTFEATVPLAEGDNRLEARCLDEDGRTVARATRRDRERLDARPHAKSVVTIEGDAIVVDARASEPSERGGPPLVSVGARLRGPTPAAPSALPAIESDARLRFDVPAVDGEYVIEVDARDTRGRNDRASTRVVVHEGSASVVDASESPAWLDDAVVYGVVPFLFGDPAFDAVRARLPELAALGVNTLWITPVQETPAGDFGYEVLDHFRVREELGGEAAFRALVDAAHAQGLRVIVDFVPSHTSREHPYFADANARGERSPYYRFHERDAHGEPAHYFDWKHLPSLDLDEPEVRTMLVAAATRWVRDFDLDGLRVDVAWGVEARAPGLLASMRDAIRRVKADAVLLAEASARRPPRGVDAAYDWTTDVGRWSWSGVFDEGHADLAKLRAALRATPSDGAPRVFRFVDNNDTGERFQIANGRDTYLLATTLLFTLPGIPSLFTGDETGLDFLPYQRETALPHAPDAALVEHIRRLTRLRRDEPALTTGELALLDVAPADHVLAFVRTTPRERVLVLLPFGEGDVEARVPSAGLIGPLVDRLDPGTPPRTEGDTLVVPLRSRTARVLVLEASAGARVPGDPARDPGGLGASARDPRRVRAHAAAP